MKENWDMPPGGEWPLERELGLGDWESPVLRAARAASETRRGWEAAAQRSRRNRFWRRFIYLAVAISAVTTVAVLVMTWLR